MAHVVTQPCCNDAGCVAVCPVNCIHPTPEERIHARTEMLYIDPATCIDCGACVDECPVDAIVPPEDLTPAMQPFVDMNAAYYEDNPTPEPVAAPELPKVARGSGVLRVAIVGSGPSACYLADALCTHRGLDVEISMIERLPVPGGLVRYGVAPDHSSTKSIAGTFTRIMGRRNVDVYLDVEVGRHLTHDDLLRHHHAVVYASGATGDRALGVPGEGLAGSMSAREFVAWYNGHPEYADLRLDLSCQRAVVVGNGNVALDVARVLTSDVSRLMTTDIAAHALEALAASRIREVVVLGRRGARSASFSTPELLGLGEIPGVDVTASGIDHGSAEMSALEHIRADILTRYAETDPMAGRRRIHLQFLRSPVEVLGNGRVEYLRTAVNALDEHGGVGETGEFEDIETGLVLRSIGFRGERRPGVPFDEDRAVIPNLAGAAIDPDSGERVPGVYTAGWLKRGPSGVIGSNKTCSAETAASIVGDFVEGRHATPAGDRKAFAALVSARQPDYLDLQGWRRIDAFERNAGRSAGRPRVKVVRTSAMSSVARGEPAVAR
ncbi:FAD-dependent oxidoreductase [Rhodococcus zopfii]|uniref:FAD-dependent oxidoreductase n=1 Tax=Rhodococcus zopfii TaxID=43772 RepID=UPI001111273F|nr:FAD-dependent oxidoreductase [Rhodococcus zopfii]